MPLSESCASRSSDQIPDAVTNRMFTKVLLHSHVKKYNNKGVLLNIK
jgi:hypothetical protein